MRAGDLLKQFFYGEHPTRSTHYQHSNPLDSRSPARTVYTGNYAFKAEALQYFIPFSSLRLRMAGPTLGRILKSEIGEPFISVNLPMLHKRTLSDTGTAEFRAGVDQENNLVDLSKEFVRQYFGDVMLFSVEQLCTHDYPSVVPDDETIQSTVAGVEKTLRDNYASKQSLILKKLNTLELIISQIDDSDAHGHSIKELEIFVRNIHKNYGPDSISFSEINNETIRTEQLGYIVTAISHYVIDMKNWHSVLSSQQ